jgi:hypothetical protein
MKTNKEIAITLAFVAYSDGSHEQEIKITKGQEKIAAGVLFSLMNTTMFDVLANLVKEKYPKEHSTIMEYVNNAYAEFMEKAQEVMDSAPDQVVVEATEVFGGKNA